MKPADENDPCYRNKRNIYLGKLNDKLIKEPKLNNQHWATMRSNMMIKKVYTIRYIHISGNM